MEYLPQKWLSEPGPAVHVACSLDAPREDQSATFRSILVPIAAWLNSHSAMWRWDICNFFLLKLFHYFYTGKERELVNNSLTLGGINSGHRVPGLYSPCQALVCKEKVEEYQSKGWKILLSPLWSILRACSHTVFQMLLGRGTSAISSSSHFISLIW